MPPKTSSAAGGLEDRVVVRAAVEPVGAAGQALDDAVEDVVAGAAGEVVGLEAADEGSRGPRRPAR